MKILMLNTLYPPSTVGGAERSVAILARALAERGDSVTVICLHAGEGELVDSDGPVTVHRLPLRNIYWPYGETAKPSVLNRLAWHAIDGAYSANVAAITNIARKLQPDVVHSNNLTGFGVGLLPALAQMGLPIVHTLRDFGLLCARTALFRNGQDCVQRCNECRLLTWRKKSEARHVDVLGANSGYMIERHRAEGMFADTPAHVIFNAMPDIAAPALGDMPTRAAGPLALGFAGRIEPEKGIAQLLEACAGLPADRWTLSIAGRGEPDYVAELQQRFKDLPVNWLGFVPMASLMEQIDALVIPSIWPEPMPRTLLEAMAWGKVVVASDAGGTPEVAKRYNGAHLPAP
ncbi:MAG: glycosyltransferase family 4 protein [Sphingomonadales bacterium]|nr:glycosyltransferase family 4 protein [Sphingomonadales bacterium]